MGSLRIRRGLRVALPILNSGELGFSTDTKHLYIGNTDSVNVEFIPAAETTDYSVFVASATYGGDTQANGKTGRALTSGSATSTSTNQLVDSTASFTSALVGETLYNSTDDTWAKVISYISATILELSANIIASGESYSIVSAVNNIPDAWNIADVGFRANIIIRISPETYSHALTLIGKTAGGAKTITLQGSTTGTTTISGEVSIYQKLYFKNLTFAKRIFEYFGTDADWNTCITSGDDGFIITKSTSLNNVFTNSTCIFQSDPGNYTKVNSTITIGYTIYIAATSYGGDDATADGLLITQGTATSTVANKLVDSTANFNSIDHLNKTVYNSIDNTWAKITAIDSTTQVSLSVNIMTSGESYKIVNAFSTTVIAFAAVPGIFNCNTIIRASDGSFDSALAITGKKGSGSYSLTLQGSTVATTNITGEVSIYQEIYFKNCTFLKRVFEYFGSSVDWTTCVTSGDDGFIITKSTSVANIFRTSSNVIFKSDPGIYTNISSTVTKDYTIYVATSTYGGDNAVADGFLITQGSATSTTANKLVDSTANFNSTDHLNKTLYNSTDDTWAKITAIDSPTQVSISANIMASGENYSIVNAFSSIQSAFDSIPGVVNCNTTIRLSGETYRELTNMWGKNFSGAFSITVIGSRTFESAASGTASSGANLAGNGSAGFGTITDSSKSWTVNAYIKYFVEVTGGTGSGQIRPILSNTATVITIVGRWDTVPDATSTYRVFSITTRVTGADAGADTTAVRDYTFRVDNGQKSINFKYLKSNFAGIAGGTYLGNIIINNGSSADFYYCYIERGTTWGVQFSLISGGNLYGCVFVGNGATEKNRLRIDQNSVVKTTKWCYFSSGELQIDVAVGGALQILTQVYLENGVTYNLNVDNAGVALSQGYSEFVGATLHNIYVSKLSMYRTNGAATDVSKNAAQWGLMAINGGFADGASAMTYSGNGSGTYTPTTGLSGGIS